MSSSGFSSTNWMSALSDRTRFYDIFLPGTHDSGTYGYFPNPAALLGAQFVKTQLPTSNFTDQLENGIRFLDLRVRKVSGELGNNLNLFHGSGKLLSAYLNTSLNDALSAARDFLQKNPSETIIASIKWEDGPAEGHPDDITAQDIQAYITKYETNSSLPAEQNGLWVAGATDFARIKVNRERNGLSDLNVSNPLVTENPRLSAGSKLNYQDLFLGDVRGKIILYLRDMPGYNNNNDTSKGWGTSTISALDYGFVSYGVDKQDKYDGPSYREKKQAIKGHAEKEIPYDKYSINYTSAASTGVNNASSPVSFAWTINAGLKSNDYKTDNDVFIFTNRSASLKTLLSSDTGDNALYRWNVEKKLSGRQGLKGAMVGDFMTAPQKFYDDFWNGSGSRLTPPLSYLSTAYQSSDHLTKLIWSQNQFFVPQFTGANLDVLTGMPVYTEEDTIKIGFDSFLDEADELGIRYRITEIDESETGLSSVASEAALDASVDDPFSISLRHRNSDPKNISKIITKRDVVFDDANSKISGRLQSDASILALTLNEGEVDPVGHRYFRLDFLSRGKAVAAPYFFSTADQELLA